MKINDKDYSFNDLAELVDFNKNKISKVHDNLYLTNYQISVLKSFNIDIESCNSLKDVIYLAQQVYEDDEDEDLEVVLAELAERNYYENTNK